MLAEQPLFFDQLRIDDQWESPSRLITEEDVGEFADLTGDHDPIHVDAKYAAQTPFRQPIAHGLLGLSFMAGLSSNYPRVQTTALVSVHDWQFIKPIFIGDSIHVITKVIGLEEHGRRNGAVRWFRQVVNQHNQVVQQGGLTTLVAKSGFIARVDNGATLHPPHTEPTRSDVRY